MNSPRVLIVATVAGTLRSFLLPYGYHFRGRGWRVDAMARGVANCRECREAFDQTWDIQWSRRGADLASSLEAAPQVRAIVLREGYDLLHVHTPVASFVARYAARSLRPDVKVVYTAHGFHFHPAGTWLRNWPFLALERLAGRWTDYLVTINRDDEEAARRYRLVHPSRVWHMPGIGVDTSVYSPDGLPDPACVRQELGLRPDEKLFTMVAEFTPGKRHRDAIAALAELGRSDVHLALAGSGPLFDEMRGLAGRLGVAERVHFLGFRHDVPALMRASAATLLPSKREGLPRSVMESLSLEVPAIGTAIRGVRDLLEGGCGLLVGVGNVRELRDAMAWALAHPQEAHAMGVRGRRQIVERYELKHVIELHEALYAEALGCTARSLAYA